MPMSNCIVLTLKKNLLCISLPINYNKHKGNNNAKVSRKSKENQNTW